MTARRPEWQRHCGWCRSCEATGKQCATSEGGFCCPSCDHHTARCWSRSSTLCAALAAWRGKPWRNAA